MGVMWVKLRIETSKLVEKGYCSHTGDIKQGTSSVIIGHIHKVASLSDTPS